MNKINQYKDRFFHLLESEIGDVRPIIDEQIMGTNPATFNTVQNAPKVDLPKVNVNTQSNKKAEYTTSQWNVLSGSGGYDYGLPKGTVFKVSPNDSSIVIAQSANVHKKLNDLFAFAASWEKVPQRVSFYCKKGKFYLQKNPQNALTNQTLGNALVKNVCYYKAPAKTNTPAKDTPINDGAWTALETTFGKSLGKDAMGGYMHKVDGVIYNFYNNGTYGASNGKSGKWQSDWNDIIIDGKKYSAKNQINNQQTTTTTAAPSLATVSAGKGAIRQGMNGESVKQVQDLLKAKGVFNYTPTTYFGPKTKAAVVAYQTANSLKPDGVVGTNTLKSLQGAGNKELEQQRLADIKSRGLEQPMQTLPLPKQINRQGQLINQQGQQTAFNPGQM